MRIVIEFEVSDDAQHHLFTSECENVPDSLHEALCQGIHEGNEAAINYLQKYVTDVQLEINQKEAA